MGLELQWCSPVILLKKIPTFSKFSVVEQTSPSSPFLQPCFLLCLTLENSFSLDG